MHVPTTAMLAVHRVPGFQPRVHDGPQQLRRDSRHYRRHAAVAEVGVELLEINLKPEAALVGFRTFHCDQQDGPAAPR